MKLYYSPAPVPSRPTGETFTIADAYAYAVLNWTTIHNIDLSRWPRLVAFLKRIAGRPAVHAYQVNALRQALKQGRDRTAHEPLPSCRTSRKFANQIANQLHGTAWH